MKNEKEIIELIRKESMKMVKTFCTKTDQKFNSAIASKVIDVKIKKIFKAFGDDGNAF